MSVSTGKMLLRFEQVYPLPNVFLLFIALCMIFDCTFYRLAEAEGTLMGGNIFKQKSLDDVVNEYGDAASFALALLGQVYIQTERRAKAVDALHKALKLNPFLWAAFEMLCRLGEKPDAETVFQLDNLDSFAHCHGTNPIASLITQSNKQPQDGGTNKIVNPEPMSIDQVCTPTPQPPALGDASTVNTRLVTAFIHPTHHEEIFFSF